jgi:hypothetical protein
MTDAGWRLTAWGSTVSMPIGATVVRCRVEGTAGLRFGEMAPVVAKWGRWPPATTEKVACMEEVVDNRDDGRFELAVGGHVGELVYRAHGDRLVLIHTEVPEDLAGQGVGGRLVLAALDRAVREGLTIVPLCPFARRWMGDHPEAVRGVGVDWEAAGR